MSVFEIAGVVLGSIPIVVTALEYCVQGVNVIDNFRSYRRVLNTLIRTLKTEHAILQDVCEKLLVGIAPQARIEEMIQNPFGELWKEPEISRKLQLRLWRSSKVFDSTVIDMREAIQEMMEKLDIDSSGEIQWTGGTSFRKYFKRASLILQKSNHEESITRIRDGVSSLQKLVSLNIDMEPERKLRSQSRLNNLVRDISGSLYQALKSSMSCRCLNMHEVGLNLIPPTRIIGPDDDDRDVVKDLQFRLAISYDLPSSERLWKGILLQMIEDRKDKRPTERKGKDVKFALPTRTKAIDTIRSLVTESTNLILTPMNPKSRSIETLCNVLYSFDKEQGDCGYVLDSQSTERREFRVHALGSFDNNWSLMPITSVLGEGFSYPLQYRDRLRLAWIISCSILQIYGTPWMLCAPTHENIFLASKQGIPEYQQVFVLKSLPERALDTSTVNRHFFLSLGILLIELVLGHPVNPLQATQPGEGDMERLLFNYEAATKLLGRVNMVAGPGYHSAVQRCLRSACHGIDLVKQTEMLGEAFAEIVGPLEEDLRSL